jgi:hypothetical protein
MALDHQHWQAAKMIGEQYPHLSRLYQEARQGFDSLGVDPRAFVLGKRLSSGTFSSKHLASVKGSSPQPVLLEVLSGGASQHALNFLVECRTQHLLSRHPNVVQLVAHALQSPPLMRALELMEQGPLEVYLRSSPNTLDTVEKKAILIQVRGGGAGACAGWVRQPGHGQRLLWRVRRWHPP